MSRNEVLTVGHAVKGGGGLEVQLWDGTRRRARVIGALSGPAAARGPLVDDVLRDLALLELEEPAPHRLPVAMLDPPYGTRVVAVGAPEGAFGAVSDGVMSYALGGQQIYSRPLEPGWSGAPLVSADGELVGLIARGTASVSLVVPASAVRAGLQELRR